MSSPLQPVDKFGKKQFKPYRLEIPVPAEAVGFAFTVFVLKSGSVQVFGPLQDVDSCVKCLELGIDRVKQFAAERAAKEESKTGAAS